MIIGKILYVKLKVTLKNEILLSEIHVLSIFIKIKDLLSDNYKIKIIITYLSEQVQILNIMKRLFIYIILLIILPIVTNASAKDKNEVAHHRCTYRFNMIIDTIDIKYAREEMYVLQIGDNFTKGFCYHCYYIDSIRFKTNPRVLADFYRSLARDNNVAFVSKGYFPSYLYKDYKKGEIRVTDNISTQHFWYEDELKPQDWVILEDTTTILGYHCQKARCSYRGRNFEAWFTSEIPLSEGPWKFSGLPGLITKLHDTENHYSFEIVGFQEVNEEIEIETSKKYPKIERKKFLSYLMGEEGSKLVEMESAKVGIVGGTRKKKNYDYIERDYK